MRRQRGTNELVPELITMMQDKEALFRLLAEGKNLADIVNLSDEKKYIFLLLATKILNEKRYTEAKEAFFFLVNVAPEKKECWTGLVQSCVNLGEYASAEKAAEELVFLYPYDLQGYQVLLNVLIESQDFERANDIIAQAKAILEGTSDSEKLVYYKQIVKQMQDRVLLAFSEDESVSGGS
jgi:tetratricopeptide (TPR) repeat protein